MSGQCPRRASAKRPAEACGAFVRQRADQQTPNHRQNRLPARILAIRAVAAHRRQVTTTPICSATESAGILPFRCESRRPTPSLSLWRFDNECIARTLRLQGPSHCLRAQRVQRRRPHHTRHRQRIKRRQRNLLAAPYLRRPAVQRRQRMRGHRHVPPRGTRLIL